MWAIRVRPPNFPGKRGEKVLTVCLSPREVVSNHLLRRIQDNPPIKRRWVLQGHSREMFRPIEHVGRRKMGYDHRQYFRVSPVVCAGRFFEQEADCINDSSATGVSSLSLKSTRLNSSDSPKARVISVNVSITEVAASSISINARASFGLENSWSSENL